MAKRSVKWTKTADIQLVGVLEYWVKRNKSSTYSKKLLSKVIERTEQISKNPFSYKKTDFKDIRISALKNFSILYKVTSNYIVITAFWDNRQDPKKLLAILKSTRNI